MASLKHSIEIKKLQNNKEVSKTFTLNAKEYILYKKLLEAKGSTIQITSLVSELEMSLSHLRVTKRNLSRLLEGWARIENLYGNGYCLILDKD